MITQLEIREFSQETNLIPEAHFHSSIYARVFRIAVFEDLTLVVASKTSSPKNAS